MKIVKQQNSNLNTAIINYVVVRVYLYLQVVGLATPFSAARGAAPPQREQSNKVVILCKSNIVGYVLFVYRLSCQ